jgi:hypothetical protein
MSKRRGVTANLRQQLNDGEAKSGALEEQVRDLSLKLEEAESIIKDPIILGLKQRVDDLTEENATLKEIVRAEEKIQDISEQIEETKRLELSRISKVQELETKKRSPIRSLVVLPAITIAGSFLVAIPFNPVVLAGIALASGLLARNTSQQNNKISQEIRSLSLSNQSKIDDLQRQLNEAQEFCRDNPVIDKICGRGEQQEELQEELLEVELPGYSDAPSEALENASAVIVYEAGVFQDR